MPQDAEIYFTIEATNQYGAVGQSKMKAAMNLPPAPGSCSVMPTSINVFDAVIIECTGWTDDDKISQYTFYGMSFSSNLSQALTWIYWWCLKFKIQNKALTFQNTMV